MIWGPDDGRMAVGCGDDAAARRELLGDHWMIATPQRFRIARQA